MTRQDRTVHARIGAAEIVRYETAGKWYLEAPATLLPTRRTLLDLAWAARLAATWADDGGEVFLGLPGGKMFDAKVRAR